jgi:protein transport protein HofB
MRPNGSWHAVGCEHCHGGFWGRQAVHEIIPMTSSLVDLVLANADASALELAARRQGYKSMFDSAQPLIEQGMTTQAEVELACQSDS